MIPHLDDLGLLLMLTGILGLLGLVPLPGVDADYNVSVNDTNYTLSLVDQRFTDMDSRSWGTYDLVENRIEVATKGHGLLVFLNTCSHEMYHLRQDVTGLTPTEDSQHERMLDYYLPWNWNRQCLGLADDRVKAAFF